MLHARLQGHGLDVARAHHDQVEASHRRHGPIVTIVGDRLVLHDDLGDDRTLEHAQRAAAVIGQDVAVVALLHRAHLQETIATLGQLAHGHAGVGVVHVAVVALLARLDEGVAAHRVLAGQRARAVVGVGRPEVALFAGLLEAVAARLVLAHPGAVVLVDEVAVVAVLARALLAVAADVIGAVRLAGLIVGVLVAVVALLVVLPHEAVAACRVRAGRGAIAGVLVVGPEVTLLRHREDDLLEAVAAHRICAQIRAAVVVVAVDAVVALLAGVDHVVAALLEHAEVVAAVARVEVAVVAALVGALVAVAADVEDAVRVAGLARAVALAVVALLQTVEHEAVAADRVLALRGARRARAVLDAVVALLRVARLQEPVVAGRQRTARRALVGVVGVAVVAGLVDALDAVAARRQRAGVAALVVVGLVAVVAALARTHLAVATHVVGAVGLASLVVRVVRPVVTLLARVLRAVTAHARRLARGRRVGLGGHAGRRRIGGAIGGAVGGDVGRVGRVGRRRWVAGRRHLLARRGAGRGALGRLGHATVTSEEKHPPGRTQGQGQTSRCY